MAVNEFQFQAPINANSADDIAKNSTIIEEGPKVCPMCRSVVRKHYISFHETIFMCSNVTCVYPFEENFLVYSSEDDGFLSYIDLAKLPRKRYTRSNRSNKSGKSSRGTSTLGTNSNLSVSEWTEMSRATSQSFDSDDNSSMMSSKMFTKKSSPRLTEKMIKKQEEELLIKQNVEKIKECNRALLNVKEEYATIRNEKWIRNLSSMQSSSGMKLVKPNEMHKLKITEDICHSELKIDIESKTDAMSSIVIEIGNISPTTKRFKST